MFRQCCSTTGWRNKPGKGDPFTSQLCWFSWLFHRILPFDSVVTCPSFHLPSMIFKAKPMREFSMHSHCSQLSPFHDTPWNHRSLGGKKSQHFGRCPSLSVPSFLPDLCSDSLESASPTFRLAVSSLIVTRDDILLWGFWLFQLYEPIFASWRAIIPQCQLPMSVLCPLRNETFYILNIFQMFGLSHYD